MTASASDPAAIRVAAIAGSDVLRVITILVSVGGSVESTRSDPAEI
jgi:hypothetical protein